MKVYLLTTQQIAELTTLNSDQALFVTCDYGTGPCCAEHSLDLPVFAAHKALLLSYNIPLTDAPDPQPWGNTYASP